MREPLPNELVIEAWKAKVGYSLDNKRTQEAYACSHISNFSKKQLKVMCES